MSEMKELLAAIGTANLGIQLDSWHWFNAQETQQDLLTLRGQDVITVDLNDAPTGLTLDQYRDNSRELPRRHRSHPGKTVSRCPAADRLDGPIQAEPFNAALRAMPLDQACAAASVAMKKAFSLM